MIVIIILISSVISILALFFIFITGILYFQGILHALVVNKLWYDSLNQEPFLQYNHLGMTFGLDYACFIFSDSIISVWTPSKGLESLYLLVDFLDGHHLPTFVDFCMWLGLWFFTTVFTLSVRIPPQICIRSSEIHCLASSLGLVAEFYQPTLVSLGFDPELLSCLMLLEVVYLFWRSSANLWLLRF